MRYHSSKVELICQFFGRIHGLTICFRVLPTFSTYHNWAKQYLNEHWFSSFWNSMIHTKMQTVICEKMSQKIIMLCFSEMITPPQKVIILPVHIIFEHLHMKFTSTNSRKMSFLSFKTKLKFFQVHRNLKLKVLRCMYTTPEMI